MVECGVHDCEEPRIRESARWGMPSSFSEVRAYVAECTKRRGGMGGVRAGGLTTLIFG